MNLLSKIQSFGAIDAENDERLLDCFYRACIIDDLLAYNKSIVIGRKGSGKTAIYKYIKSLKKEHCVELLFRDYPWKTHDSFKNCVVSERESYVNSWTFFFYIEILKKLVEFKDNIPDPKKRKELGQLAKWLKRNWGSSHFDFREVLNIQKPKFRFTFAPSVLGNSLGSLSRDLSQSTNLGATLSEYNKKIEKVIASIITSFNDEIVLMFDELDLSYAQNDVDYNNRLIGLLLAAYNIHPKFDKRIRVIIFLRNDIFNQLEFQDKNKIKDNLVAFLDWGSTADSPLSLKLLVASRIADAIESKSDNFERNWNEIFDGSNIG